jgi:RHS repeat-associated protein
MRWLGRVVCLLGLAAGGGASAVEQVVYYHTDALGSPVAGTDAEGGVLWRESYLPYGERRTYESREQRCGAGYCRPVESQADEKVWYTGKFEEPGVGLVYLGARWYDPELGRFLSPDPAGYDPEVYESFNAYAYGNNNPYRYVDPSGEVAETVWDVASIGVGLWSLGGNVLDGNWRAAGVDAVGLAVDGAAAVIPFAPGGAGMAIRAGREAGEAAADVAKVAKNGDGTIDVYRVFGGDARAQGFSWTTKDPRKVDNFRDAAGLPSGGASGATNTADFLIKGKANASDIIKSRSALPLDGNKGGLPELIIDPKNVNLTDFSVLKP